MDSHLSLYLAAKRDDFLVGSGVGEAVDGVVVG